MGSPGCDVISATKQKEFKKGIQRGILAFKEKGPVCPKNIGTLN